MTKLLSYHNDEKLKKDFLREITKHIKADQVLQGTYGKENGTWRGCAVACSLRSLAILEGEELVEEYSDHSLYEEKIGVPEWLARLEDTIFEGLPKEEAPKWVKDFSNAIPVGVDLNPIKYKFCAFILKENIDRVLKLDIEDSLKEEVVKAIQGVLSLHEKAIKTGKWDKSAAESAEGAAWSAAWSAAESAASAEGSAKSAAWSAAESAASAEGSAKSAAESAAYKKYAKELIKLLKESK